MPAPQIRLFGTIHRAEFIPVVENLPDGEGSGSILFQSYPGEFSQKLVNQLIADDPLAPILLFLGAACEGEVRTGRPLSGCFRLYVHQWNEFYRHQLSLHLNGHSSLFSLPRTAENDEIALFQHPFQNPFQDGLSPLPADFAVDAAVVAADCLIVSRYGPLGNDSAMNRLLAAFFRRRGFRTEVLDQTAPNSTPKPFGGTLVADADDSPFSKILESVQRLRQDFTDSKVKVCINSPRINEKIDLRQIGVDEILSKPVFW